MKILCLYFVLHIRPTVWYYYFLGSISMMMYPSPESTVHSILSTYTSFSEGGRTLTIVRILWISFSSIWMQIWWNLKSDLTKRAIAIFLRHRITPQVKMVNSAWFILILKYIISSMFDILFMRWYYYMWYWCVFENSQIRGFPWWSSG